MNLSYIILITNKMKLYKDKAYPKSTLELRFKIIVLIYQSIFYALKYFKP